MKKLLKRILKILTTLIICLFLLEIIKNNTIAAEKDSVNINTLFNMSSDNLDKYIGSWTTDGYKFFGVLDFYRSTGAGYTYSTTGGYFSNSLENNNYFAIASYLANCSTSDALKKGWKNIFNSIKVLMSEGVANEFKNISIDGNVNEEMEEAKAYADFLSQFSSGRSIDTNNRKVNVKGTKIGPITLTTLAKDTKKGGYKYTDGTKNVIKVELSIKGEGIKTLKYDVVSDTVTASGISISGKNINGIKDIAAGKPFYINITNPNKTYTFNDISSLRIYDQYKLYSARVFLFGKKSGNTGLPDIKVGPQNLSRK